MEVLCRGFLSCGNCRARGDPIRISWSSSLLLANSPPFPYRMKSLALFHVSMTCKPSWISIVLSCGGAEIALDSVTAIARDPRAPPPAQGTAPLSSS